MEDGENLLQFSDILTSTKGQEVSLYTPPVLSILQGSRESTCCYSRARGQGSEGVFLNQGKKHLQTVRWLARRCGPQTTGTWGPVGEALLRRRSRWEEKTG